MNKLQDEAEYAYYCVAFIDMLGQKEAFLEDGQYIDTIENNLKDLGGLLKKLNIAHGKTYQSILGFRKQFRDFFDEITKDKSELPKGLPENKIELFKEMRKAQVDLQFFTDCLVASTTLKSERYYSTVLNSVHGIIFSCGNLLLLSLASRAPFRAGIDVGFGIKINQNEVYGPALFRAYEYEAKTAKYPRIIIGNQLMNFLGNMSVKHRQFDNQDVMDIEWCKLIADQCLTSIIKDTDGEFIFDYLSSKVLKGAREDLGFKHFDEVCIRARDFIDKECVRFKESGDDVLSKRYTLLQQYFIKSDVFKRNV